MFIYLDNFDTRSVASIWNWLQAPRALNSTTHDFSCSLLAESAGVRGRINGRMERKEGSTENETSNVRTIVVPENSNALKT